MLCLRWVTKVKPLWGWMLWMLQTKETILGLLRVAVVNCVYLKEEGSEPDIAQFITMQSCREKAPVRRPE